MRIPLFPKSDDVQPQKKISKKDDKHLNKFEKFQSNLRQYFKNPIYANMLLVTSPEYHDMLQMIAKRPDREFIVVSAIRCFKKNPRLINFLRSLVEKGADVDERCNIREDGELLENIQKTELNDTNAAFWPITEAIPLDLYSVIEFLREEYAEFTEVFNEEGYPVLMLAANNHKMVKALLKAGADVNEGDLLKQSTPLHECVHPSKEAYYKPNDSKLFSILVQAKANLKIKNNNGDTPLDLILKNKNKWAVESLEETGFDVTTLHKNIQKRIKEILKNRNKEDESDDGEGEDEENRRDDTESKEEVEKSDKKKKGEISGIETEKSDIKTERTSDKKNGKNNRIKIRVEESEPSDAKSEMQTTKAVKEILMSEESFDLGILTDEFDEDVDDSTDEEEVESAIANYDIDSSWEDYRSSISPKEETKVTTAKAESNEDNEENEEDEAEGDRLIALDENDDKKDEDSSGDDADDDEKSKQDDSKQSQMFSFVSNAAGQLFLFSRPINKKYYPLKKYKLTSNASNQLAEIIATSLKIAINNTIHFFVEQYWLNLKKSPMTDKEIDNVRQAFISSFDKVLNIKNIRSQIKTARKQKKLNNDLIGMVEEILLNEKEFLQAIINKFFKIMKPYCFRDPMPVTEDYLLEHQNSIIDLSSPAYEKALDLFTKNGVDIKTTCKQFSRTTAEKTIRKKVIYNKYSHLFGELFGQLRKGASSTKQIKNYLNDGIKKQPLATAYLKDLVAIDQTPLADDSFSIKIWEMASNDDDLESLKIFLRVDEERLRPCFKTYLFKQIKLALKSEMIRFGRTTLDDSYELYTDGAESHFANLRLNMRSQKRLRRNLATSSLASATGYTVSRIWRYAPDYAPVPERQEITTGLNRRDQILNIGKYEKEYQLIIEIQKYWNKICKRSLTDNEIAVWVRDTLNNPAIGNSRVNAIDNAVSLSPADKKIIQSNLNSLTQLLFGTETVRNLAMVVIVQMMLDLIIAGKLTWKQAFITGDRSLGGLLPMVPKGSTPISRQLNTLFAPYLPLKSYVYEGTNKDQKKFDIEELMRLQSAIVKRWLKWKAISTEDLTATELYNAIQDAMPFWYKADESNLAANGEEEPDYFFCKSLDLI